MIATGSRPRVIPGFEFDGEKVLSSTDVLMLESLPKKIIILGAGAIGMEFAYILSSFGVEVHIAELLDRVLPMEDADVSDVVSRTFRRRKIKISTGVRAVNLEKTKNNIKVKLEAKDGTFTTDEACKIVVSAGRSPNTEGIGLENVGIKTEKGFIPVGDYYQTALQGIYAIGDVINTPLLAHVASKEAEIAAAHMAGRATIKQIEPSYIPSAVYCEPQVGSFGPTEEAATQAGIKFNKAVFNYKGAGKAVAIEEIDGFVKVLYAPDTKEILAAHVVGAEATEIIHEILLAKTAELLPEDVAEMIHAHPTLSEAAMEAMKIAEGR